MQAATVTYGYTGENKHSKPEDCTVPHVFGEQSPNSQPTIIDHDSDQFWLSSPYWLGTDSPFIATDPEAPVSAGQYRADNNDDKGTYGLNIGLTVRSIQDQTIDAEMLADIRSFDNNASGDAQTVNCLFDWQYLFSVGHLSDSRRLRSNTFNSIASTSFLRHITNFELDQDDSADSLGWSTDDSFLQAHDSSSDQASGSAHFLTLCTATGFAKSIHEVAPLQLKASQYVCNNCSKSFGTRCKLNRHNLKYSRPIRCRIGCESGPFQTNSLMERHIKQAHPAHSKTPLFLCPVCPRTGPKGPKAKEGFARRETLLRHLQKKHPAYDRSCAIGKPRIHHSMPDLMI